VEKGTLTVNTVKEEKFIIYEIIELRMALEQFPEQLSELNAIYFIKNSPGPVPQPSSLPGTPN
jgi:hypothetical protein